MPKILSDQGLIDAMLPNVHEGGTILLRNDQGTMELRGEDLELRVSDEWLTIYHGSVANGETRSHLHLRRNGFRYARVVEQEGTTPFLGFWTSKQEADEGTPPLAVYFPSFFDWSHDKAPIEENQGLFRSWLDQYGGEFELEPPGEF